MPHFRTSIASSFSGGDACNNYRATVDYKNAQGVDIRSSRQEYGGRVSLNHTSKNELWNSGPGSSTALL